MFEDAEWSLLLRRLIDLTRTQKLDWVEEEQHIKTQVGNTWYEIGSVDNDGRQPYYLAVLEGDPLLGLELARLESEPEEDDPWGNAHEGAGILVHELRRQAIRSARGAPKLLSKLLGDLAGVSPDEEPPF